MNASAPIAPKVTARDKILDAAIATVRAKGYAATSVDDLCASAGVTKGAFFHHFKSKHALGVAAAARCKNAGIALRPTIATPPCFRKYRRENLRPRTPSQHL